MKALSWSAILMVLICVGGPIHAGETDANGNTLPGSDDRNVVKLDSSKDKELSPVQESWCQPPPEWEVRIGLPGWFLGLSGDLGVKGVAADVDIPFHGLFDHFNHVPLLFSIDTRYQRWEIFGDGEFYTLSDSVSLPGLLFTNANIHLTFGVGEAFIGYRLINCQRASLSLFAGARYTYLGGQLTLFDNGDAQLVTLRQLLGLSKKLDFSANTYWVDPVVGARGKVEIWKAVSIFAEGDAGGFDANSGSAFSIHRQGRTIVKEPNDSSDWSYQVQGGLGFQLTRSIWTRVGWRYLKYDYNQSGFTFKPELSGPFIQTGINF